MLSSTVNQQNIAVFFAIDNEEYTYRTVSCLNLAMCQVDFDVPFYVLDVDGDSTSLVGPDKSFKLEQIAELELTNPDKTFIIITTPMNKENLEKLRMAWGFPNKLAPHQLQTITNKETNSYQYPSYKSLNERRRYKGTGARILFIDYIENVFELGTIFKSVHELAQYDFCGYILRGVANYNQFQKLTSHSQIAGKPAVIFQAAVMYHANCLPKKFSVCYSSTMIRFMAIENIKYFFKMQDPELFSMIEFINLADRDVSETIPDLESSFAFICLDMAQEYPILMPEAMRAGNIILGFNGNFDNYSDLNSSICDFSKECDYRDVADKLVSYARDYYQNLLTDPNYIHELAQRAKTHAESNYLVSQQYNAFLELIERLNFESY